MNINNAIKSAFENYQAGNFQEAENICKKIVQVQSDNINAINLLGLIYYQLKNYDSAIHYTKKLISLNPTNFQAYYIIGHSLQEKGEMDEAIAHYQKSLQLNPNLVDAYYNLGTIFQDKKRYDEAISCYQKALQLHPTDVDAYYNLGFVFQEKGLHEEAIASFWKALQLNPTLDEAYGRIGLALQEKGQFDESIRCYKKAVELNPNNLIALYGLGTALTEKGELDSAITYYQKALLINPNHAQVYTNLGIIFQEKGELDSAITYYQKALLIDPNLAQVYTNLGIIFQGKGELDSAITYYQKALLINPKLAEAYSNLGAAFEEKGQWGEAVLDCYKKALEINPDLPEAYSQLTYQVQQTCNWQDLEAMTVKLDSLTRKALDTGTKPAETPFMSIIRHADPSLNFAIAKSWSHDIERAMSKLKIRFSFNDRKPGKTKIIIGYLSDRFRNTATAHLMLSLFGLHNRDEFSIYSYSYGKDDGSSYRARIAQDCDKFVDISSLSDVTAARCIYEDQVDILVDLKGHTRGSRLAIRALRPAPIQVSYLGFAGTTGADFIDYIITDKIVTPEDHLPYYSEKCVYMPHCYLVNDHTQPISNKDFNKVDFGLPENCFVFCSFNQPYKIDPIMFNVWMRILQQVPESVLWLLFGNKIAKDNLRQEAEARGVKSERLIFAKSLPKDEHLSRLKLADLALDTRIVNGHTTTSDALWAGVPVITLQGSHFASRVSSSILSALGLSDLITHSLEAYEALAVRLANNPVEIREIRKRVAENRRGEPLFDTARFVRNLETAYKEMWKIFLAGEAPRQIEVLES
jgi:protein O-GlcNAc transferase